MRKKMNNPVAKYLERYNRPVTHDDRKKKVRRGYQKHKIRFHRFTPG